MHKIKTLEKSWDIWSWQASRSFLTQRRPSIAWLLIMHRQMSIWQGYSWITCSNLCMALRFSSWDPSNTKFSFLPIMKKICFSILGMPKSKVWLSKSPRLVETLTNSWWNLGKYINEFYLLNCQNDKIAKIYTWKYVIIDNFLLLYCKNKFHLLQKPLMCITWLLFSQIFKYPTMSTLLTLDGDSKWKFSSSKKFPKFGHITRFFFGLSPQTYIQSDIVTLQCSINKKIM